MDMIFNMYKVKYKDLGDMFHGMNRGSVQVFINLEPVFRWLHKAEVEKYLKTNRDKKVYEMISNILNLAAHYRHFFTKMGRYTEVIMYVGSPTASYSNTSIIPDYRENTKTKLYDNKTVYGRFLREMFPLVSVFCHYIEGLHFITSNTLEPSLIPSLLSNNMPNKVIVTTDRYDYQYCHMGYNIIRPKKGNSSYLITKDDVIYRMKLEDKIVSEDKVSSNFIPLILSFLGDPIRGMPKIKGVGLHRIIKIINDGIENGHITENTTNLTLLENLLNDEIEEVVKKNFMVTDIKLQLDTASKSAKILLEDQKVDKFDNDSLKRLNNYFIQSPIMLNELQPLKEKKSIFEI